MLARCDVALEDTYTPLVKVLATWNRRFPGVTVFAFGDRSYLIDFGAKRTLLTIGWYRWHPDFIEAPRTSWGPWHFSESMRFRRMSHVFDAAMTGRELTAAELELVNECDP